VSTLPYGLDDRRCLWNRYKNVGEIMRLILISFLMILSSCTLTVNLVQSCGESSDLIDENQDARADIDLLKPAII